MSSELESFRLPGPEIPDVEVDESGVFRVLRGDVEICETARLEFFAGLGLDQFESIEWLWPERIPLGLVTVLEGAVNLGKSLVLADVAARVTRGAPWPGRVEGPQRAGDVLFVGEEQGGWQKMAFPRLQAAGADLSRIARLASIQTTDPVEQRRSKAHLDRRLAFPADLGQLEYCIRGLGETRLVIIDSLSSFCADDKAWRETLRQLGEIAERRNVAIVVAARPTRRTAARNSLVPASDRRSDDARCVFNVLADPEDPSLRYLAPARISFCATPQWLPFTIGAAVAWGQPLEDPPEGACPTAVAREKAVLRREVIDWLKEVLRDGDMPMTAVAREARRCGYSGATLRRAREQLGVRTYRQGFGVVGVSWWSLRPANDQPARAEPGRARQSAPETGPPDGLPGQSAPSPARRMADPGRLTDRRGGSDLERFGRAVLAELFNDGIGFGESLIDPEPGTRPKPNGKPGKNGRHKSNGKHGSNGH